ncbi:MAG: protein kinase [Fuerstiella sp.]|nr:protein kinase [Fuerstiella sp.]
MGIGSKISESERQQVSAEQLEAGTLVTKLINSSPEEGFSAKHLLTAYPMLRAFPGCVADLAYEQYCRDVDAGKNVTPTEFVKDFSNVQQSLYRILEFDQLLHEHPSLVEGVPSERWPQPGETFCEFQLEEQIGRGALSRVFVAREARLGQRQVVVKVCIRGAREADLLGKLECEGIARIHSVHADEATGLGVICMPYLTRVTMHHLTEWLTTFAEVSSSFGGQNAAELMQHVGRLNDVDRSLKEKISGFSGYGFVNRTDDYASVILKWGSTLANALAHAHHKNVLHLDVKPGNVLVLPDLSVSLLDFNLASAEGDDVRLAGGTLPYMAAEQLLILLESMTEHSCAHDVPAPSPNAANEATDVFGLCATLWHLVAGEPPFGVTVDMASRRDAARSMLERQENGVAQKQIDKVASVLPCAAVELLLRGLSFDGDKRPAQASELCELLNGILLEIESTKLTAVSAPANSEISNSAGTVVSMPSRSNHRRVWTVAFALALTAALALILLSDWNSGARQPADVTRSSQPAAESDHEKAFRDAVASIEDDNIAEAAAVVKPYLQHSLNCRRVDLYCRTCQLPALVPQASGIMPESPRPGIDDRQIQEFAENQARIRESWEDVLAEWEQLAFNGVFPVQAWLNIAYIQLEFSDFEGAKNAFRQAEASGLAASNGRRVEGIVELMERQESGLFPKERSVHILEQTAVYDGSRGEFLAFLSASVKEIDSMEDGGSAEAVRNLFALFDQHKVLVGSVSGADVLLKSRPFFESQFGRKLRALKSVTTPPPPHRIHRVLQFP